MKAAAETFRPNKDLDTAQVITELGKGEALVSFLEGNGSPSMVERTMIAPPTARVGPVTPAERKAIIADSPFKGKYDQTIDPESAYEILQKRMQGQVSNAGAESAAPTPTAGPAPAGPGGGGFGGALGNVLGGMFGSSGTSGSSGARRPNGRMTTTEVVVKQVARSVASQVGTQVGRALVRGVLGSFLGGRR